MHINHSGANINITTAPNCQNNFIFNHTAPISLNFYKENNIAIVSPTEGAQTTEDYKERAQKDLK